MDSKIILFQELSTLFHENGFRLFLVGGTVRDYLLDKPLDDMDCVTDALPEEMKHFLPDDSDYTFSRFGCVKVHYKNVKFDVTTLREESSYADSRRPNTLTFVKDLSLDVKRRDFTINAMYLDSNLELIDYVGGKEDLKEGIIRMVGNPFVRIREDLLRIIRAFRFAATFGFIFDEELEMAICDYLPEINQINQEKIKQDLNKTSKEYRYELRRLLRDFNADYLITLIK